MRSGRPEASSRTFAGLQVAVDDPRLVERVDGEGDVADQRARLARIDGASLGDHVLERLARDDVHGVPEAPRVLTRVVHLDHVGVVEARDEPGLAPEALARDLARLPRAREDLDRQLALEPGLAHEVDDSHAPAPELAEHFVRSDPRRRLAPGPLGLAHPGTLLDRGAEFLRLTRRPLAGQSSHSRPTRTSSPAPWSSTPSGPRL